MDHPDDIEREPGGAPLTDEALVCALLVNMPVEGMVRLARHFKPLAIGRHRRGERDGNIRKLAAFYISSGRGLAEALRQDCMRYAGSAWIFERDRPAPADPKRALMHRVLSLNGGKAPSDSTILRALVGLPVAQNQCRK
ncbi:MAG: hypothetical protein QOJ54_3599 [Aliidongia sp.]|jgi:hypothetical protein|nr:hypothetical protein [Aliidongia sp.]